MGKNSVVYSRLTHKFIIILGIFTIENESDVILKFLIFKFYIAAKENVFIFFKNL